MIPKEFMPPAITPAILQLSGKLNAGNPIYVTVQPDSTAISQQCYLRVDAYVQHHGGEPVEGWLIWEESKHRWLLAVHHCIWRSSVGQLVDVMPHADKEAIILFAAGGRRWDRVHPVAGQYEPLVADKNVRGFCDVSNDILHWLEHNTVAGQPFEPDLRYVQLFNEQVKLLAKLRP